VITPFQAGGASRALHPPRNGASGCSAKGRSATRSDSQRSHLTNQVGWPTGLGMEAEALLSPTERRISQPAAGRRRTAALATTSGSHVWDGRLVKSQATVLFFAPRAFSAPALHSEESNGLGVL
jgi:hypothetical protein